MHIICYLSVRELIIWEEPAKLDDDLGRLWEPRSAQGAYHARPNAFLYPPLPFTAKLFANCCKLIYGREITT